MPSPYPAHRRQIESILLAWGMPQDQAARTADVLGWADLHGVDSHSTSMIVSPDGRRRAPQDTRRVQRRAPEPRFRADRRRWRAGPCRLCHGGRHGDRQGQGDRNLRVVGAQLLAFRRRRLFHQPCRGGRANRDGRDERGGNSRGADGRGGGAARHRPVVVFCAEQRGETVPPRHRRRRSPTERSATR